MVWRRHQDHLRQHSVTNSEATLVIAPTVSNPQYSDLVVPDYSTDSQANETEESRPAEHPPPHRNPNRKRTKPKRYVA